MHTPIMLKDFMEQYQENRITLTKQENPKSKFRTFINSFLVDTLIFIAAILTMFLAFVNNLCSYWSVKIKGTNNHHGFAKS